MRLIHIQKSIFILLLISNLGSCFTKKESQDNTQEKATNKIAADQSPRAKPDTANISPNRLIVPGKSIGLTVLQEKAELVTARLGKPDSSDAAMGKALATWFSKPVTTAPRTARHQTTIYFKTNMGGPDEASRVDQIRVTSPYFFTTDSIHVSSGLPAIQKAFPRIVKVATYNSPQNGAKITIYDAAAAGIAFEINEEERCVAITVHAANQEIKNTYLPLFPDMQRF